MIKIMSQDENAMYDIDRNNIFVCGNQVLISDKTNIYEAKAALLGAYESEGEAKEMLQRILNTLVQARQVNEYFYIIKMPPKGKEEKNETKNDKV